MIKKWDLPLKSDGSMMFFRSQNWSDLGEICVDSRDNRALVWLSSSWTIYQTVYQTQRGTFLLWEVRKLAGAPPSFSSLVVPPACPRTHRLCIWGESQTSPLLPCLTLPSYRKRFLNRFPRDLAWGKFNGYKNANIFRAASGGKTNYWFWVILENF